MIISDNNSLRPNALILFSDEHFSSTLAKFFHVSMNKSETERYRQIHRYIALNKLPIIIIPRSPQDMNYDSYLNQFKHFQNQSEYLKYYQENTNGTFTIEENKAEKLKVANTFFYQEDAIPNIPFKDFLNAGVNGNGHAQDGSVYNTVIQPNGEVSANFYGTEVTFVIEKSERFNISPTEYFLKSS